MLGLIYVCERELKTWIRNPWIIALLLINPILYVILFSVSLTGLVGEVPLHHTQISYISFFGSGMAAAQLWTMGLFAALTVYTDRTSGFIDEILVSPLNRWEIALGKILGSVVRIFPPAAVLLLITIAIGANPTSTQGFLLAMFSMLVASVGFASLGISLTVPIKSESLYNMMVNMADVPLMLLSTALYPLEVMPPYLQAIARFNPISYVADAIRFSLYTTDFYLMTTSLCIPLGFFITFTTVSCILYEKLLK